MSNKVSAKTIKVIELTSDCGAFAIKVNTFIDKISVPGGYSIILKPNSPKLKIKLIIKTTNKLDKIKGIRIFRKRVKKRIPTI